MLLLIITYCCSSEFVIMNYSTGTEGYYKKMLELQEKLRRSEEERLKLEEKFNEMMRFTRDAEHERLRVLRHKYHKFLEDDRVRQERNENILRALDRIESQARTFAAKTDRFKALRKQYNAYIRRIYAPKNQQQQNSEIPPLQSYPRARKQLFSDLPATQRAESKIAMLEQYLQDNFSSVPLHETNGDSRQFSRQNDFSTGYALPEVVPSKNTNYLLRQSTVADSESKDSQDCSIENHFPSRRLQNELELKFPEKHIPQSKKYAKSELLGNTIEQELDRFREKESTKQTVGQKTESTPDPYVQNYKDLVSESAKKFGLHNGGSITNSPKRTSDMKMDIQNEEKINLSVSVSDDSSSDKIISDTLPEQRDENKVKFAKHPDSEDENPTIKEYKEVANTLREESIENAERNNEELVERVVSPEPKDDGEKLEVLDDNVDLRSKTPEVSSARTEPPDDVTLTTPSPIHLPVSEQSIAKHKHESLVSENIESSVYLDQKIIEQQSGVSKDLQNDKLIPQTKSSSEKSVVDEEKVSEDQQLHEEELDQNNSTIEASHLEKPEPEYQALDETGQPVYDNQDYHQNVEAEQVYEEEYQPQDGYDPQSYPVQEHLEGQPEVYDAEQYSTNQQQLYPVDQQQYPVDQQQYPTGEEEHYSVDQQQYSADQQQYPVDQQQYPEDQQQYPADQQQYGAKEQQNYPTDQEQYLVSQQEYPLADQQQYSGTDQYPIDQQQYPADQQQYPADQQQYPVDQQQYPADQQQYLVTQQEYPVADEQQYSGTEQYPADQQQYSAEDHEQEYPAHQQQYITEDQQQYQTEYPPEQYSGQPADYDPAQYPQHYETDQQQPYVEGEYDPQSYPDGYNQDVYRSEHEYLQAEQNIDLQYQTEVTAGEEYQGEFTNNEYQPELQQDNDAIEQGHQQSSSSEPVKSQKEQEISLPPPAVEQNISESTEKSVIENVVQQSDEKPVVEKQLPNLADMLDTDTESTKQETKVSNDSDFDFTNT